VSATLGNEVEDAQSNMLQGTILKFIV